MKTYLLPTLLLGAALLPFACGEATDDSQPPVDTTGSDHDTGGDPTGGDPTGGDPASGDPSGGDTSSGGDDMSGGDSASGGDDAPATCGGVPVSDACLAVNCENELQVGRPCTAGGGECGDFSLTKAWLCTSDFYESHLSFCTMTCQNDEQCGTNAVCGSDPDDPGAGAGCVPVACAD